MEDKIKFFLSLKNYDIKIHQDARWIDQKCTCDVLSYVADFILNYTDYSDEKSFTILDIWKSKYADENIQNIFSKPSTKSKSNENEYDKFFSQPIKLLSYSGLLQQIGKKGNAYCYKINNIEILDYISRRDTNALKFLQIYILKVLRDSEIYEYFEKFFNKQDKDSFYELKTFFIDFTITHTKINGKTECGRIFTKILNPLAVLFHKKGTIKGNISKTAITYDDIRYNRINWRDAWSGKEKSIARKDHIIDEKLNAVSKYYIEKAKRIVRRYNDIYNCGVSEVIDSNDLAPATQMHHIFPAADFPIISDYVENIIALSPNHHYSYAHPDNNTKYIDKDFQYICLIAKTNTIICDKNNTYDFDNYKYVLNTGLGTNEFNFICSYYELMQKIDLFYSDCDHLKYDEILKSNSNLLKQRL